MDEQVISVGNPEVWVQDSPDSKNRNVAVELCLSSEGFVLFIFWPRACYPVVFWSSWSFWSSGFVIFNWIFDALNWIRGFLAEGRSQALESVDQNWTTLTWMFTCRQVYLYVESSMQETVNTLRMCVCGKRRTCSLLWKTRYWQLGRPSSTMEMRETAKAQRFCTLKIHV